MAVVGEHFWAAKQGLEALDIAWDPGENADLTTGELRGALADALRNGKSIVAREEGKRPADGKLVEAVYQLPMLAHAPMEPLNTTVSVTADKCEIWVGTQVPTRCVAGPQKSPACRRKKSSCTTSTSAAASAAVWNRIPWNRPSGLAKQVKYPIKIIWTREEDIRHDIVRPMYHDHISAVLDTDGRPLWFGDRITGGTVLGRWAPMAMGKNGLDGDLVECAAKTPYDIANVKVEWIRHDMPDGLLVGWWRGVGSDAQSVRRRKLHG